MIVVVDDAPKNRRPRGASPFGDEDPFTLRNRNDVARTFSRRCYPHIGNGCLHLGMPGLGN